MTSLLTTGAKAMPCADCFQGNRNNLTVRSVSLSHWVGVDGGGGQQHYPNKIRIVLGRKEEREMGAGNVTNVLY